jgi:hypothetical protein
MGLLDFLGTGDSTDPRTMAGLALAAGLMSGRGFADGAIRGMTGYNASMERSRQQALEERNQEMRRKVMEEQINEIRAQAAQRQADADKLRAAQQRMLDFRGALRGAMSPMTPQQALAGGGGPTAANAAMIGAPQPANRWQQLAADYPEFDDKIKSIAGADQWGVSPVAHIVEQMIDGKPYKVAYDAQMRPVGKPQPMWVKPEQMNGGGTNDLLDPVTGKILAQYRKTMAPGEAASHGLAQQRFAWEKDKDVRDFNAGGSQLLDTQNGYVRVGRDNKVTPLLGPDNRPVVGAKDQTMTESQGNASAFYIRAKNATDTLGAVPVIQNWDYWAAKGPGGFGNFLMSAPGQRAVNAEKQFIAAVLRKESGAAISANEYSTYGDQFFPRPGDDESTLAEKARNRMLALEGMKIQAGPRGASMADAALSAHPRRSEEMSREAERHRPQAHPITGMTTDDLVRSLINPLGGQ